MIPRIIFRHGLLEILDQRLLPGRIHYLKASTPGQAAKAIKDMALRGAPLIGCAAAYGYALALNQKPPRLWKELRQRLKSAAKTLKDSRPTAMALAYAVDRLDKTANRCIDSIGRPQTDPAAFARLKQIIRDEADAVFKEDVKANDRMGDVGAGLFKKGTVVMTHCNAGALATAGIGTAVGVIFRAHELGRIKHAYSCETRPYMQGSRLTIWELQQEKVPSTLITDNMAAHIIKTCKVDAVIVGADRIAANGDTANKIGTYGLAVIARYHKIPFYVAAPIPTIDMSIKNGSGIPIEERDPSEVCEIGGIRIAPKGIKARHPAFDVTPNSLITAIITEKGLIRPVNAKNVAKVVNG